MSPITQLVMNSYKKEILHYDFEIWFMLGMYMKAKGSYYNNKVLNEMLHCDLDIRSRSLVVKLDLGPARAKGDKNEHNQHFLISMLYVQLYKIKQTCNTFNKTLITLQILNLFTVYKPCTNCVPTIVKFHFSLFISLWHISYVSDKIILFKWLNFFHPLKQFYLYHTVHDSFFNLSHQTILCKDKAN